MTTQQKQKQQQVRLTIDELADLVSVIGSLEAAGGLDADPSLDERNPSARLVRPFTVALGEDLDTEATFAVDGSVTIRENLA